MIAEDKERNKKKTKIKFNIINLLQSPSPHGLMQENSPLLLLCHPRPLYFPTQDLAFPRRVLEYIHVDVPNNNLFFSSSPTQLPLDHWLGFGRDRQAGR